MIVRFGYVAMSTIVKNASPSKTMTATNFSKLVDRDAAVRKLERIAAENLHNTLRLLYHNRAHDIKPYRFSSRLIPLIGHEMLGDWDPIGLLAPDFAVVGDYVKEHGIRVSFHPDHFTVLSTPRADVLKTSHEDLDRHVRMFEAMGLDEQAKCSIHIGGAYGNKEKAMERFLRQFSELADRIKQRIALENDDKTFNAKETLYACEQLGVPMVLDIHHHTVNNEGEDAAELWPRIMRTWGVGERGAEGRETQSETRVEAKFEAREVIPKIHVSSPKSEKDPRGHADYVNASDILKFLRSIAPFTPRLDVMIEAKMKDRALFQLMKDVKDEDGIVILDQASVEVKKSPEIRCL